jgi:hypothetical protein
MQGVVVRVEGRNRWAVSAVNGRFCLEALDPGVLALVAERIGLVGTAVEVELTAGIQVEVELIMSERALELPGVVVSAREGPRSGGPGSRSTIDRSAVEHLQASSLADVLQLLPGQVADNPGLSTARQSLLRQVPTTTEAARANALGTSLVMDGAPISNNANLQTDVTILNSGAGSLPPFSSVAGRGVDLRSVSPDEIESVEVIRGIPSARHGDLTTGLILVQTRVGARTPEIRLRANPTLLDLGVAAGWGDGVQESGWSATGTLTGAQDDPRQTLDNFYRGGIQLAWRSRRGLDGRPEATLRFHGWSTLDERRRDPDDTRNQIERSSRDQGFRVSLLGGWNPRPGSSLRLSWTGSASLARQEGRYQSLVGRSITPVTTATTDTTVVGVYGPSEYLNVTTVDGRPVNLYTRVEGEGMIRSRLGVHRPVVGAEWRMDGNRGEGRQFDLATPPRQNYNVGDRPRSFRGIPSLHVLSLYVEDRLAGEVAGRRMEVGAGFRWDNLDPVGLTSGRFGTELQPRVNASVEVVDGVRVRAGAGRAAKAPPLAYLHPGPRYFDLVNLNYFAQDPAERLLILTTRVVKPSNEGARAFTADKWEAGVDLRRGRISSSLVYFDERTRGAYGWDRELVVIPVDRFGVTDTPEGRPPVITPDPVRVDTFYSAYDVPSATRDIRSSGVEFTLELPEWERLRTSLVFNGGWTATRVDSRARSVDAGAFFFSSSPPARVGVYRTDGSEGDRFVTAARFVHRAPDVGLLLSALVQTVWWDRRRATGVDPFPLGFVDRAGDFNPLTPEAARIPGNADLVRQPSESYLARDNPPPLWLMNLRLSKTLPAGLEMSFFANNVMASRPLYENPRTGGFVQRNPPLFFGVELVARPGRGILR